MIRVAAFTGGANVPSARYRVRQLIDPLMQHGIAIREYPARFGSYPPHGKTMRLPWAAATLAERTAAALHGRSFQVTLLQREMVSTLCSAERLTRAPRVLDVDDAIWLNSPAAIERLCRMCDVVVCGNRYIQDQIRQWNPNTALIPTAVDVERYRPSIAAVPDQHRGATIGWSGTSSGHPYLSAIEQALRRVLVANPSVRLRIISDRRPALPTLPETQVEFVPWSPATEVSTLQDLTVGIMPLIDSPWARGKCSFKMLTYMACGIPVVASPVGMNADVFAMGRCGRPASTQEEWVESLNCLVGSPDGCRSMGDAGRRIVEAEFSTERAAASLAAVIRGVAPG